MENEQTPTLPTIETVRKSLQSLTRIDEIQGIANRLRAFIEPRTGEDVRETRARESAVDQAIDELVPNFEQRATIYRWLWGNRIDDLLPARADARKGEEAFIKSFPEHVRTFSPVFLKHALMELTERNPGLVFRERRMYQGQPYAATVLREAALGAATVNVNMDAETVLQAYEEYRDDPAAERIVTAATNRAQGYIIFNWDSRNDFNFTRSLGRAPYARTVLCTAAGRLPDEACRCFANILTHVPTIAGDILQAAIASNPLSADRLYGEPRYRDDPVFGPLLRGAHAVSVLSEGFRKSTSYTERHRDLDAGIRQINAELVANENRSALDAFNTETGLSVRCMGITIGSQLIFINTFEGTNTVPVRITLLYGEMRNARTREQVLALLRAKWQAEQKTHKEDYQKWQKAYQYDLPRNGRTAVMIATVPGQLRGIESDMARMAEIYHQQYGASFTSIAAENPKAWAAAVKQRGGTLSSPEASTATAEGILKSLQSGMRQAIDGRMEAFIFHFMMHGGTDATAAAVDKSIPAQRIAEILATPYGEGGRPLCAQIDITIFMESCYSGSQLEAIIAYLRERRVPVKNLRIIAAAARNTVAAADQRFDRAALIDDNLRQPQGEQGGTFPYYFSYYFTMVAEIRARGGTVRPPLGTYAHAVQFADRMTREESEHVVNQFSGNSPRQSQNPEAIHYSTEGEGKSLYFSSLQQDPDSPRA